jgi:hypothetical protein
MTIRRGAGTMPTRMFKPTMLDVAARPARDRAMELRATAALPES